MAQRGSCARFAQETLARGVVFEVSGIDDLQGNREAQVGVVSLVGDPHRPSTQFPEAAILTPEYLVLVIALGRRHGRENTKPKVAGEPQTIIGSGEVGRISDLLKILLAYFTFSWKKELHVVAGDLSGTNDIAGSTRMVAWVDRGA